MAESVFTELVRRAGRAGEFVIDSAATSTEEIGNPPHHGTIAKLREVGIPVVAHRARQVRRAEYGDWDHIVYMDDENARALYRIFGKDPDGKISRLLDWTDRPGDVADPWYTGNFDATYRDVLAGCTAMLETGENPRSLSRWEKIHAHECDKGTTPLPHPGLALDRLDLQLYPFGAGVAQNIRKGPGRI